MLNEKLQTLAQWVQEAKRITVLSGAGMSTESGIPDFRSTQGVWTRDRSREEPPLSTYFYW